MFFGRTDVEVEAPILWPPDTKNWLIGKDPDPGQDWRQEEEGTTEDEIVGWHELMTEVTCRQFPPLPGESPMASLTTSLEEFGGFFLTLTIKTERGSFDFLHDIH